VSTRELQRAIRLLKNPPGDLRSLPADYDAAELVSVLTEADIVIARWPESLGGGHRMFKGVELSARVLAAGKSEKNVVVAAFTIANTMQAEMIERALLLIDRGKMDAVAVETLGSGLGSVSHRGEPH
jgi:hypothetical protein